MKLISIKKPKYPNTKWKAVFNHDNKTDVIEFDSQSDIIKFYLGAKKKLGEKF